ncbi:hypothetical protein KI387_000977 [Taxus chinensis]|uniref:Homeobox domain-containing protein n=1 Tax=Taxus chinensis TaxID=29808 RepID=A0AA38GSJ4_TAXCH|nr:hypothetical protein KI387_000977 [Taxus chinensis]
MSTIAFTRRNCAQAASKEVEISMFPASRKISYTASEKVRTPGAQCRRLNARSSSAAVSLRCRKNNSISFKQNFDPIFGELQELPECREVQRLLAPGSLNVDYLKLRPDFSIHKFWSELSDLVFDPDLSCELPANPYMDADFDFLPIIHNSAVNSENAKDFGEEMKVLEQEKVVSSLKWTDFLNPCSFFDPDDRINETIPRPVGCREPESEIVKLESNNESSMVQLSSTKVLDDHAQILTSSMKIKKASTSARSQKKRRLNPGVSGGSFGESFTFQKISADMELQEAFPYQYLRCNEVLPVSDSEGESVQIVRGKPSSRRSKKRSGVNVNRHKLPEHSLKVMKAWLERHMSNPYTTNEEKLELVKLTGLTLHQVENWLSNTRYKLKIQKVRSAKEDDPEFTTSNPVRKTLVARNKKKHFISC